MSEYTKNQSKNPKTIISNSISKLLDFHHSMKNKFVYVGADFSNVIRELVSEVENLKKKENISLEWVEEKEDRVDRLINFYNVCEQILEKYSQHLTAMQLTSDIIERTFLESRDIDEMILRNSKLREEFLKV